MNNIQNPTYGDLENSPPVIVNNQIVGNDWLKGESLPSYRAHLHNAFEIAQINFKIRKGLSNQEVQSQQRQLDALQLPSTVDQIKRRELEHKIIDPEMPEFTEQRRKLLKIGRNCRKKKLERFFEIDPQSSSLVQYVEQNSQKPTQVQTLADCKVVIEKFTEVDQEEQAKWAQENAAQRVVIKLKDRKFKPVHYYTETRHEAICIQFFIDQIITDYGDGIPQALVLIANIRKLQIFSNIFNKMSLLKKKRIQTQQIHQSVLQITNDFNEQRLKVIKIWDASLKAVNLDQSEEASVRIPQILSSFRYGKIQLNDAGVSFRLSARILKQLVNFIKQRKDKRHPIIQDMIKKHVKTNLLDAKFSYKIHDQVLENMHKIGNIPYSLNDVDGTQIKIDGHEYFVPINEICFMATDYGYRAGSSDQDKNFKLILNGRKFSRNVETSMSDNLLPSQLGLEKIKCSRLNDKQIINFSLKTISIPKTIRNKIKNQLITSKDKIVFRIKFEVGEFHCFSMPFSSDLEEIQLKDELQIEINEVKHIKISLTQIITRPQNYQQFTDEFKENQVLNFVTLRLSDFDEGGKDLQHHLTLNSKIYNPNDQSSSPDKAKEIVLTAAFILNNKNGAFHAQEMEGHQLLIGKYAIYRDKFVCKVLKVNKNNTCSIQLIESQPLVKQTFDVFTINEVNIKTNIKLIERYGVSCFNINASPQNYAHGQFEWVLEIRNSSGHDIQNIINKVQAAIQNNQAKQILQQRIQGSNKKGRNKSFICGKVMLSVLDCQNLSNSEKVLTNCIIHITVRDSPNRSNAKFIDIAHEESFIQCQNNSKEITEKTFKGTLKQGNNNPSWISKDNPHGEVFDLGYFLKQYPHFIQIEVFHQKNKTQKGQKEELELVGFTELNTMNILSIENFGQEFYLFLEETSNKNSTIKLQTLFIPSNGTIQRLELDPVYSTFKNAQQFLFYQVLNMHEAFDMYGYKVPIGGFDPQLELDKSQDNLGSSLSQTLIVFNKRYEQFSPTHKRVMRLKEKNPARPKIEENNYIFNKLWPYFQFERRNIAFEERQRQNWEAYMNNLMQTPMDNANLQDEMKSLQSKWTNTTKMISSKYKKNSRNRQIPSGVSQKGSNKNGQQSEEEKGRKFSVLFIGQWEKEQNQKYVDIWYLIKYGIPSDLRVNIWKDLLRRTIHEQYEYIFFKKDKNYEVLFNTNISVYQNLRNFANARDSVFCKQIEQDVKEFQFPVDYLKIQKNKEKLKLREERIEKERFQIYQILKVFDLWAQEFQLRRKKIIIYNKGLLAVVQRMLNMMNEEDAFWMLIGIVKGFNHLYTFEHKEPSDESQLAHFSPFLTRRIGLKNEMAILNCIIKIHNPLVYDKLKSLGMPIEWYFYDQFSQMFAYTFSSDLVLRLWDMILFNLSTNQLDNRKRGLWYLLAVPLYMIQINQDLLFKCQTPLQVKNLLINRTASINYNPDLFIDELLTIIKYVFVQKNAIMSKLFGGDKAANLENLRKEVELQAFRKYQLDIQESKILVKYAKDAQIDLQFDKNTLALQPYQESYQIVITILGFRNLFKYQPELEETQIQIQMQCQELFKSPTLKLKIPQSENEQLIQLLEKPIELKTRITSLNEKKIVVGVLEREKEAHQVDRGKGTIYLDRVISSQIEQKISIKLNGNRDCKNAYIDLTVRAIPSSKLKSEQSMKIQGFYEDDPDIYQYEQDQAFKKTLTKQQVKDQIKKKMESLTNFANFNKILREYCAEEQTIEEQEQASMVDEKNQILLQLNQQLNVAPAILAHLKKEELNKGAYNRVDQTRFIIKIMLIFMRQPTHQSFQILFRLFSKFAAFNTKEFTRLIHHLYDAFLYQIPFNEIQTMVNYYVNPDEAYQYLLEAKHQNLMISQQTQQAQGFFSFVKGATELITITVTDQIKNALNQIQRMSGLYFELDMNSPPFNNINFWLKVNTLKRQQSMLVITMQDNKGDLFDFKYKFNEQGLFDEKESTSSVLPLQHGGSMTVSEELFIGALTKMPLLSDFIRQRVFLDSQLEVSSDEKLDSSQDYRITFQALAKKFLFIFTSKKDKNEDFTIDKNELNRISKGDVKQIYKKYKDIDGSDVIEVNLSSLSKQDTFIWIKKRIRVAMKFIIMSENLRDVPNIMNDNYQFKVQGSSTNLQSFDRIETSIALNQTNLEIIRVQNIDGNQINNFDCYGLYLHANNVKQWRLCRIQQKISKQDQEDIFKIEYMHELGNNYQVGRENILLSYDFKRLNDEIYQSEMKEFLDKMDKDEVEIALQIRQGDVKGFQGAREIDEIKKNINFNVDDQEEQLKIKDRDLDDMQDIEVRDIENIANYDE